ncbi:MerR family transcriptional regulator [Helicobacter ailurogastricus]|uniref:MerR family transcriptional regulator n=1 Tax=Helicobacter ailurogastricus TaxID=1578720 RepID=UPI001E5EBE90|nr:MerR family transcriptional regulator [Helicobacter ailurogastricus]
MALTIIEVERQTGIPSRKIRFWCDKGLFPFVQSDSNGVRYFSKSDIAWVEWVQCLRAVNCPSRD